MLLIGGRLGEMPSSDYTLLKSPYPDQTLVHVHPDASRARPRLPSRPCRSTPRPPAFVAALAKLQAGTSRPGRTTTAKLHAAPISTGRRRPKPAPGRCRWARSCAISKRVLPDDAIITNGAGNYATWVHRFHRFRRFGTQAAPTSGSMGYGTPAAVAAKALYPGPPRRRLCRRRLLPDERPGIRNRRAIRPADRRRSSSTTASTARSACTRSANIRAGSWPPT